MKRVLTIAIALLSVSLMLAESPKRQECARIKAELNNLRAQVKSAVTKIGKLEHDYALMSSQAANEEANKQRSYRSPK